jgi:hypothetical protein
MPALRYPVSWKRVSESGPLEGTLPRMPFAMSLEETNKNAIYHIKEL